MTWLSIEFSRNVTALKVKGRSDCDMLGALPTAVTTQGNISPRAVAFLGTKLAQQVPVGSVDFEWPRLANDCYLSTRSFPVYSVLVEQAMSLVW